MRYLAAAGAVGISLGLRMLLSEVVGPNTPYITFFPAVMFAAWFGGGGPGVLATILSLGAALRYFIPPADSYLLETLPDAVGAFLFLAICLFISLLTEALRRSRFRSEERLASLQLETGRRAEVETQLDASRQEAERSRDLLQITLASVADGVIATDAEGRVTFLNAVAESLIGCSLAACAGKHLDGVFQLRNEQDGVLAENPVDKVLRQGTTVRPATHTELVSRSGRAIPVEDNAAPIRDTRGELVGVVLVLRDATERRAAEAALRLSEERLQLAVLAGRIGVWDWDVASSRIEWSDLLYEIHGLKRGEFDGTVEAFQRRIHPEDQDRIREGIASALQGAAPYNVEFRIVLSGGAVRWISTTAMVFRDSAGQPTRMLGCTTDITPRKQAEAELRQQGQTFDAVLSNTADSLYTFDRQGRFTYANRATLTVLRKSLVEVAGRNLFELGYPDDLAATLSRQIQQVVETGKPVRDEFAFTNGSGEHRQYDYILEPVYGSDGTVEAVAGSTRDVTEQAQMRQALAASEERIRQIFLQAPIAIVSLRGPDLVFEMANTPAAELLPGRKLLSRTLRQAIPELSAEVSFVLHQVRETGQPFAASEWLIAYDRDGDGVSEDHWFNIVCNPLRDSEGAVSGIIAVALDVSEQVRSRRELERVNQGLEEFAYVASHDLQEPLRMVNTFTQLLFRSELVADTAETRQFADFIRKGVNRMEQLIRDLLAYSRASDARELIPASRDLRADLSVVWAEAVAMMDGVIAESGATITAEPLPTVAGDPSQFSHVFQNLLSNALKYRRHGIRSEITVSVQQQPGQWLIAVRDNGIGFEQKYARGIFGLFKRLHRDEYPGTGLGLAICQRIIQRYDGNIWAESEKGVGSVFFISLPVTGPTERSS